MAIKGSGGATAGRSIMRSTSSEVTAEEFKEWLRSFDTDRDGRISREELRQAMRSIHVRFSRWQSRCGLRYADGDGDGFIGDDEIDSLIHFAQHHLGLKITTY